MNDKNPRENLFDKTPKQRRYAPTGRMTYADVLHLARRNLDNASVLAPDERTAEALRDQVGRIDRTLRGEGLNAPSRTVNAVVVAINAELAAQRRAASPDIEEPGSVWCDFGPVEYKRSGPDDLAEAATPPSEEVRVGASAPLADLLSQLLEGELPFEINVVVSRGVREGVGNVAAGDGDGAGSDAAERYYPGSSYLEAIRREAALAARERKLNEHADSSAGAARAGIPDAAPTVEAPTPVRGETSGAGADDSSAPASWSETGQILGVANRPEGRVLRVLLDEPVGAVWPMRVTVAKADR